METGTYFKTIEIEIASVWRDRYLDARIFPKPQLVEDLAKRITSFREPGIAYVQALVGPHAAEAPRGARYRLVAGSDLVEAARLLGRKTVEVRVVPPTLGEGELRLLNVREALRLRSLSYYERAHALHMLMAVTAKTIDQLADMLGDDRCRRSTIATALHVYASLGPTLLDAWRDGHPLMTVAVCNKLANLPQDEQLKVWHEVLERDAAAKLGHDLPDSAPSASPTTSTARASSMRRRLLRRGEGPVRRLIDGLRSGEPTTWTREQVEAVLSALAWLFEGEELEAVRFGLYSKRGRPQTSPARSVDAAGARRNARDGSVRRK